MKPHTSGFIRTHGFPGGSDFARSANRLVITSPAGDFHVSRIQQTRVKDENRNLKARPYRIWVFVVTMLVLVFRTIVTKIAISWSASFFKGANLSAGQIPAPSKSSSQ
jgi:hypothetical protein